MQRGLTSALHGPLQKCETEPVSGEGGSAFVTKGWAMTRLLRKFWLDDQGQDIAEYAVMLAVNRWFGVGPFVPALKVVQKLLSLASTGLGGLSASHDCFGCVRPHQLRPIFLEQLCAGEKIGPDHFAVHCDDNADGIAVAQL